MSGSTLWVIAQRCAIHAGRELSASSLREQLTNDGSSGGVSSGQSVSVSVQGHARLDVPKPAAYGSNIVTSADELGRIPVTEIVKAEVSDTGLLAQCSELRRPCVRQAWIAAV
jgi:hypothetical protein